MPDRRTARAVLAVDSTGVYWVTASSASSGPGAVLKAGLCGATPTKLADGVSRPSALTLDGTRAYWTDLGPGAATGAVMSVPLAGGTAATLASDRSTPAASPWTRRASTGPRTRGSAPS